VLVINPPEEMDAMLVPELLTFILVPVMTPPELIDAVLTPPVLTFIGP